MLKSTLRRASRGNRKVHSLSFPSVLLLWTDFHLIGEGVSVCFGLHRLRLLDEI